MALPSILQSSIRRFREWLSTSTIDPLSTAVLVSLLLLRIVYLGVIRNITYPDYPVWLLPSEMFLAYLGTLLFIWLQRNRLDEFHVTHISLFLLLIAPVLTLIMAGLIGRVIYPPFFNHYLVGASVASLAFSVLLVDSWQDFQLGKDSVRWTMVGLLLGLLLAFLFGFGIEYVEHGEFVRKTSARIPVTLFDVEIIIFSQLAFAASLEEPLFRGFLWGAMRKWGFSHRAILLIQGLLFWGAHIYYLGRIQFSFWFLVPSAALVFGWLAWRSRSITPGLFAHTFVNALSGLVRNSVLYFHW